MPPRSPKTTKLAFAPSGRQVAGLGAVVHAWTRFDDDVLAATGNGSFIPDQATPARCREGLY